MAGQFAVNDPVLVDEVPRQLEGTILEQPIQPFPR